MGYFIKTILETLIMICALIFVAGLVDSFVLQVKDMQDRATMYNWVHAKEIAERNNKNETH